MFRISRKLDYGIQLMVALAKAGENKPIPTAKLSEMLDIPLPFLHQIGHSLMQAGLIKASPGPRGGIRLSQDPHEITVLEIAESLEGKICLNNCLSENDVCQKIDDCTSQKMWATMQDQIINFLGEINLEILAKQEIADEFKSVNYN
ncbi:MAG TPA: Rrf2 family transcriptional regulator [Anaerolineaceae bacterium]|nr:Rrf2 family transcriptional regulator [Anaerolineaceae bacterium]